MEYINNKTKPYVDIAKVFFAINIALLHYDAIDCLPYSALIKAMVTRLAVPYFFVASGYFWAAKIYEAADAAEKKAITISYCKRMGLKLLIFEPISIAVTLVFSIIRKNLTAATWISIIQGILFYPSGAMWYIQAVIVAVMLLTPFVLRRLEHLAIIPALILYMIGALGNRYFFLVEDTIIGYAILRYEDIFICTRNGLFFGCPFVLLGCLIARFETQLLKPGTEWTKKLAMLFAACYCLCFLEFCLVNPQMGHSDNALYLSYLLVAPMLFVITARGDKCPWNTLILRRLSTSIYLIHRPIGIVTAAVLTHCLRVDSVAVITCTGMLIIGIICMVVYRNKRQPFYGWLT